MTLSSKIYDDIINLVKKKTSNLSVEKSKYLGYCMILFHSIFLTIWICYFLVGTIDKTYYILLFIFWFLIFFLHYLFDGCLLVRIERVLLHSKTYGGLWEVLYYFLINDNYDKHIIYNRKKNIRICGIVCLLLIIFLRIIFDMK